MAHPQDSTTLREECVPVQLVDSADRTVSVRAFTDADIFALEQQSVFTHSWLCLGHRSQFKVPGDFVQTRAGTRPMLLCLGDGGEYHAFVNVCSHRGARVCQLESGHAERFVCPYHSWAYNHRGELVSVPRKATVDFDKSRWGLRRAARVATCGDLIFATFSDRAPSLDSYLGDFRWYLDLLLNSSAAGTEVSAGTHRSRVHCNWKVPAEQFGADNWHFQSVHGSLARLGRRNEDPLGQDSFHAYTPQGHMLISVAPRTEVPSAYSFYLDELLAQGQINVLQRRLLRCTLVMTIFPNLSFVYFPGMCSMRLWHPLAVGETELWSWALHNRDAPAGIKRTNRTQVTQLFSPSGMLEQDDLEVWAQLGSNLAAMPPSFRLCYAFGGNHEMADEKKPYPGSTAALQSDVPAFEFYRSWASALAQPPDEAE
jgi:phenylpropionate dioxygenase-like ring-hydroxylating dioxygenase large terminal subunit